MSPCSSIHSVRRVNLHVCPYVSNVRRLLASIEPSRERQNCKFTFRPACLRIELLTGHTGSRARAVANPSVEGVASMQLASDLGGQDERLMPAASK
jgi:hypothetical protein